MSIIFFTNLSIGQKFSDVISIPPTGLMTSQAQHLINTIENWSVKEFNMRLAVLQTFNYAGKSILYIVAMAMYGLCNVHKWPSQAEMDIVWLSSNKTANEINDTELDKSYCTELTIEF